MKKHKREPSPLDGINGQLMVIAAHRYCLGRSSYIVGSCIEWIQRWWPEFDDNTRRVIVRDTTEALQDGERIPAWKRLAEWMWRELDDKQRAWVYDALAHRDKPWPLDRH